MRDVYLAFFSLYLSYDLGHLHSCGYLSLRPIFRNQSI